MAAFSTDQIGALTTDQVAALETADLRMLSTAQLQALSTEQIEALSSDQVQSLSSTQLQALTTDQVATLATEDLQTLTTAQFAALTTGQIEALTTDQFASLSTDAITALTTAQAQALTTDQIAAFTTDQIAGLATDDIAVMTTAQIAAFEGDDIGQMSGEQLDAFLAATPIVLDLDGNGVSTLSASHGVQFDLNATGTTHTVGWASATDGLLAMDRNHDGTINNGSELFGTGTTLANGQRAGDGYAAMADLDSNHDGVLNAGDVEFKDLRIWVDADSDGQTDARELLGLSDYGIVSLDLNATAGTEMDHGNLLGLTSSYTTADGQSHDMADVWFSQTAAQAPSVDELLTAPSANVLPAELSAAPETASTAAPAAVDSGSLGVARNSLVDEDQKLPPLI